MQNVREQRDLASLPEPRFIYTAPTWLRGFAAGILIFGAVMGGGIAVEGFGDGASVTAALGGILAAALCLSVLVFGRPTDWRVWINLAATPKGLYLVARGRRVVFVPWQDVLELGVEQGYKHRFARLTLRLPEEGWAQFGKLSSVKGPGAVRQYLLSALAMPGDALVAKLKDFRAANC